MDCSEKIMNITAPMYIVPGAKIFNRGSSGDEFIGTVRCVTYYPAIGYKIFFNQEDSINLAEWYAKDDLVIWQ